MEDDRKQIEHDPEEVAPNRKREYPIDPWWVVGLIAILTGLYVQRNGFPKVDGWVEPIVAALFLAFCVWNYWPRQR